RLVSVGEYVREGTALYRLVADDPIKFRAQVPERYVDDVHVGQPVSVTVAAYSEAFTGRISRINPQIDPASRMFQVEVLVANPQALLRPGAFARGAIATHVDEQVTFVPRSAVVVFAGVKKLFTVQEGKAVQHLIETGVVRDDYIEVTSGFSGEHPIVVSGADN